MDLPKSHEGGKFIAVKLSLPTKINQFHTSMKSQKTK